MGLRAQDQEAQKEYELARKGKSKAKSPLQGTCQGGACQGRGWTLLPQKMQVPASPLPLLLGDLRQSPSPILAPQFLHL